MPNEQTPLKSASDGIRETATAWALAILENAADGVITIDERGIVQWLNPAAEALFGYTAGELVGRSVNALMPRPEQDQHDCHIARYLRTGERKIIGIGREVLGVRKNGSTFPMYLSVCETIIGGARVFGGIVRDLSKCKQAEDELRHERDFTRRLLDTAEVIVLVLDARGRIVLFNRHMERLAGTTLAEVRERDWIETFVPKPDQARTRWLLKQAIAGVTMRGSVYPVVVCGGEHRQIEWFESPLEHVEGRGGGLLCIGLDVTERIEAEQQRFAYEEKLHSLTEELISSEERERRDLAVELHDQIGQTLALAKIKLGGLREAVPQELFKSVTEIRDLVDQAVKSSRSLTLELGATILHELGLEAALAGLVEDTQRRHSIACKFEKDAALSPLDKHTEIALFRAVRELLINVVKHASAKRIDVTAHRTESSLFIRVYDDGAGFVVPKEGFHATHERGFGLFSIQERISRLGGSMQVVSNPGRGTCVTLEAPLARSGESEASS